MIGNVARFNYAAAIGVCEDGDDMWLVLDWCDGGNLREFIEREYASLSDRVKFQMTKDIACGLAFLHVKYKIQNGEPR